MSAHVFSWQTTETLTSWLQQPNRPEDSLVLAVGYQQEQILLWLAPEADELVVSHGAQQVTELNWQPPRGAWQLQVLAKQFSSHQLGELFELLNAESIYQLTPRSTLGRSPVIAFTVDLDTDNPAILRERLAQLSQRLELDLLLQTTASAQPQSRLLVFDMDSTLIQAEVIDELAKEAGIGEQVATITESAMRGEINFDESFRRRMGLLKGLEAGVLEKIAERLQLTEGLEALMDVLVARGYHTAILSGGFYYFANGLKARLGFNEVHANQLDVVDDKVTGIVEGEIVNAAKKAELLGAIAQREGYSMEQTVAVGDGANDLPMLASAGLGVAFHAKPLVVEKAELTLNTCGIDGVLYLIGEQPALEV